MTTKKNNLLIKPSYIILGLLCISIIIAVILYFVKTDKSNIDPSDFSDSSYYISKAFDTLGTKSSIENYSNSEDDKYNVFMKIAKSILGKEPDLCYLEPSSVLEKDINISEVTKQVVRKESKNKQYQNIAAISILYMSIMFDLKPEDFEVIRNKKGIVKFIKVKDPNNSTKFLTLGAYRQLIKNIMIVYKTPEPTELDKKDDIEDIDNFTREHQDELLSSNEGSDENSEKINIVVFSKLISIYITNILYPNRCSLNKKPKNSKNFRGEDNRKYKDVNFTQPALREKRERYISGLF